MDDRQSIQYLGRCFFDLTGEINKTEYVTYLRAVSRPGVMQLKEVRRAVRSSLFLSMHLRDPARLNKNAGLQKESHFNPLMVMSFL